MWIAIALATVMSVTSADQTYDMKLKLSTDTKHETAVSSELADLFISGTSMGLSGSFKSKLQLSVLEADDDSGTYKVQILVLDPKVTFNETEQAPPTIAPIVLTVDDRGRVKKIEGVSTLEAMDMTSAGGIPVVLLSGVACLARLPDHPVTVGEEWELEDQQPTPFGVVATAKVKMKLAAVEDNKARLEGSVEATCPEFKAPNPMQPGMEMTVKEAVVKFTDFTQIVDLETGLVNEASGRMEFAITADMQGMELPAQAFVDFVSCPDAAEADEKLAKLRDKLGLPGEQPQAAEAEEKEQKEEQGGGEVVEVDDDNFAQVVLNADKPVLVDFFATWCGPCQRQAPIVEKLARAYAGRATVARLDIEKAPKTARKFSVEAIPTLIIFNGGKEVWRAVGLRSEQELRQALDQVLGGVQGQQEE